MAVHRNQGRSSGEFALKDLADFFNRSWPFAPFGEPEVASGDVEHDAVPDSVPPRLHRLGGVVAPVRPLTPDRQGLLEEFAEVRRKIRSRTFLCASQLRRGQPGRSYVLGDEITEAAH